MDITNQESILEALDEAVSIIVGTTRVYVNKSYVKLYGLKDKSEAIGQPIYDRVAEEQQDALIDAALAVQKGLPSKILQFSHFRPDGKEQVIQVRGTPITYRGQQASLAIQRDVTHQVMVERELRKVLAQYQATLESTTDGLLVVDEDGHVVVFNQRFAEMWGLSATELKADVSPMDKFRPVLDQLAEPAQFLSRVREVKASNSASTIDTLELRDGRIFERYSMPYSPADTVVGRVWSFRDVTSSRRMENELRQMALHDSLTLLPNRVLFMDRLEHALAASKRTQTLVGVLFMDLDDFKSFNDRFGHAFGDRVLAACARQLVSLLRAGDTAGRIGGDEFVVLLEGVKEPASAEAAARRILAALEEPTVIEGRSIRFGVSIGLACGSDVSAAELLHEADAAMYEAKRAGKGRLFASRPDSIHPAA